MTRDLDPVAPDYPWTYTAFVVDPPTYARVHARLAAFWTFGNFDLRPDALVFTAL